MGKLLSKWRERLDEMLVRIGEATLTIPSIGGILDTTVEKKVNLDTTVEKKVKGEEEEEKEKSLEKAPTEGDVSVEEDKKLNAMSMDKICLGVDSWFSNLNYAVDTEDTRRTEEVQLIGQLSL